MRADSFAVMRASGVSDAAFPAPPNRCCAGRSAAVSSSEFHAPQWAHCPCHLVDAPPHSPQT